VLFTRKKKKSNETPKMVMMKRAGCLGGVKQEAQLLLHRLWPHFRGLKAQNCWNDQKPIFSFT